MALATRLSSRRPRASMANLPPSCAVPRKGIKFAFPFLEVAQGSSGRRPPASGIISAMTIGITGPRHRAPWRGAVVVLIIAAIVLSIGLILLGLTGDFLIDWLWFSTIGYLGVFWTTIAAESRSLHRRLRGDRYHPMGERIARVTLRSVTLYVSSRRLRMEAHRHYDVARRTGIHAPSAAVASRHRRRR